MLSPAQLHTNKGQVPGSSRSALPVYLSRLWVAEQGWKKDYGNEEPDGIRQMLTSFLRGHGQLFKEVGTGHEHLQTQGTGRV